MSMLSARNHNPANSVCFLCFRSNINHCDTLEFFQRNWVEFRSQLHFARTSICTLVVVQIPESLRKSDVMSTCVLAFFSRHRRFSSPLSFPSLSRDQIEAYFDANRTQLEDIKRRASPNEITIIKRPLARSRVDGGWYRATIALPSHRASHRKVKWIIASNVENHLPISHSSIFHRVASLLPTSLRSLPASASATINYTVYFGIKRDACVCDLGL